MPRFRLSCDEAAEIFERVAELLDAQGANPYRVRAYREAAKTLRSLDASIAEIYETEGEAGLDALPGIGKSLTAALVELLRTGKLRLLERLTGEVAPEDLFAAIPGIGHELARRIHRELEVETLEELELAAHDGRLERLAGFGPRRVRLIRDGLAATLGRSAARRGRRSRGEEAAEARPETPRPSVALLLELDERYRREARAGRLRTIAPRRFNPRGEAWLPILHADREGWALTALFSNTARTHALGKTDDWVVIYAERDGVEQRWTVVTETHGPRKGRRVVRGREGESDGDARPLRRTGSAL